MSYNQNILIEVERHILLHHKQILGYYRGATKYKAEPKAVLKWNKLVDLYWKSSGMCKIGDRK